MTTENTLTYKVIRDRCLNLAQELLPDLPTTGTLESWESYDVELAYLRDDSYGLVLESVESTDWAIYTHYGWKILHAVPQSYIDDAEDYYLAYNGDLTLSEINGGSFDIWNIQFALALYVLIAMVKESLDSSIEELQNLVQTQLDNLNA